MATRKEATNGRRTTGMRSGRATNGGGHAGARGPRDGSEVTGRYIVTFRDGAAAEGVRALAKAAGVRHVASSKDFTTGAVDPSALGDADAIVLDRLGMAIVSAPLRTSSSLGISAAGRSAIESIEPEHVNYALSDPWTPRPSPEAPGESLSIEYLRGWRDGIASLVDRATDGQRESEAEDDMATAARDTARSTWGLLATRVTRSAYGGRGIRIAVLDTGFDMGHPEFAGRTFVTHSFIAGETEQDGHGHGTHCIGTACGPKRPPGRRYGVAYGCEIHVGKVLSNAGSGADGGILAGINWAVANRCQVVSMSLGRAVAPGEAPDNMYEVAGRRALAAGTLIVAAAGNDSQRPADVAPVGSPANARTIMAVAAVDSGMRVAEFSNGGVSPNGGSVDVAGPGVRVYSSWPRPTSHRSISGTSMATPHVAGIAALICEARNLRGRALWDALVHSAAALPHPATDVGAGLVQAP